MIPHSVRGLSVYTAWRQFSTDPSHTPSSTNIWIHRQHALLKPLNVYRSDLMSWLSFNDSFFLIVFVFWSLLTISSKFINTKPLKYLWEYKQEGWFILNFLQFSKVCFSRATVILVSLTPALGSILTPLERLDCGVSLRMDKLSHLPDIGASVIRRNVGLFLQWLLSLSRKAADRQGFILRFLKYLKGKWLIPQDQKLNSSPNPLTACLVIS